MKSIVRFLILLCGAGLCAACGSPTAAPTLTNAPATAAASTSTAAFTVTAPAVAPTPTTTAPPPTAKPIQTALPTFTATPCIDRARFVNETVPDNTVVKAGEYIYKAWTLENTGTCIWEPDYALKMNTGGGLTSASPLLFLVRFHQYVQPGARMTITVTLTAPLQAGTYRSDFMLLNTQRLAFGVGASGQTPIYAQVVVTESATAVGPTSTPGPTQPNCTYHATYVSETVPDNTKMFPGELFSKQWTVKNTGTCTWFGIRLPWQNDGGLRMPPGVPRSGNPQGEVPPGGTFTLGWPLIAPQAPGTYHADFKLGVADGPDFGLGQQADVPLTVQIVVVDIPSSSDVNGLNLGTPAWHDAFDRNEFRWALEEASNANVTFAINNGGLVMDVQQGHEYWTVGSMPASRGQVQQAVFQTGETCTGQNTYGLLVGLKADAHSNAFTNGYLFRFTCDGQYSVGYVDSATYIDRPEPYELVDLTANAAIRPGPNQTNRLTVLSAGGRIMLYANDSKVLELRDFTTTQYENGAVTREFALDLSAFEYFALPYNLPGRPGLFVSGEASRFTVVVDEYSFWDLEAWVK